MQIPRVLEKRYETEIALNDSGARAQIYAVGGAIVLFVILAAHLSQV